MKILAILTAAAALVAASFMQTSCSTTGFDSGPLADATVTVGASKLLSNSSASKRAGRAALLENVAAGLDDLDLGNVTRAAVEAVLDRVLVNDPEFRPLVAALVVGFFPAAAPADQAGPLHALAKRIAADIRAGIVLSGVKSSTLSAK